MNRKPKLTPKDTAVLQDFLSGVRAALGNNLVEVKLFGSKATGKDQQDSDIDVLIVVKKNGVEIEDRVLDIAFDVNLKRDVYMSPRVIARGIFRDPVWSITPFLRAVAKEGVPL